MGHTCAVACGEVWCWGHNDVGQLGDGTVHSRGEPRRVEGVRARQVATGSLRSCAVLEDGHVECWGYRHDDDASARPASFERRRPELVPGLDGVRAIAIAWNETCALRDDERVYCWANAVVGDPVPARVAALEGVVDITASFGGTCALTDRGVVWCDAEDRRWSVLTLPGRAQSIDESCAVVDGQPYCRGFDQRTLMVTAPRAIAIPERIKQATGDEKCGRAVTLDGRVWSWGDGPFCRLWQWAETTARYPATVVEGLRAEAVSSGCAWSGGGRISCWGPAADGALGDGRVPFSTVPLEVRGGLDSAGNVDLEPYYACAAGGGSAECWGTNMLGEVGAAEVGAHLTPQRIPLSDVRQIAAGILMTCAVTGPGDLWCWGRDQPRTGLLTVSPMPLRVPVRGTVTSVALGGDYSCVALSDGSVDCWGWVQWWGDREFAAPPGAQVLAPRSAARVLNGLGAICGISATGSLTCVGENVSGDLGLGGPTPLAATPPLVVPGVIDASIGEGWFGVGFDRGWRRASCLVLSSGALECWGYNGFGQVGDGTYEDRVVPTLVTTLDDVRAVDVGPTHTCAIDAAGAAWCWGDNRFGQLGGGTENESPVPVRVLLDEPAATISLDGYATCAQVASGRTFCWGSDATSVLGRADPPPMIARPQRVVLGP